MILRKSLLLSFVSIAIFLVAIPFATAAPSAIQENFNVNKFLKTEEQGQGYFKEAKDLTAATGQQVSPVAAFVVDVINFLTAVIGSVSLLIFITGALLTIVSEGKEDRLQKGKEAMLYALIGLVLTLAAYLIATFVQSIFF